MNNIIKILLITIFISIILPGCQTDGEAVDSKKERIAFISDRDQNPEIYVMDINGKNPVRITNNNGKEGRPSWSPDGNFLAFASDRNGVMNDDIFTVKYTSGGGERKLTQLTDNIGTDKDPAWSPLGDKITYISNQDSGSNEEVLIMESNGENKIRLTTEGTWKKDLKVPWRPDPKEAKSFEIDAWVYNLNPAWSPDGKMIAFETFGLNNTRKIYFINPDDPRADGRAIKNIKLISCNIKGNPSGDQAWSTEPGESEWVMGVFSPDGKLQNPVDEKNPLKIQGQVVFDLYMANSGWFKKGQYFKLTITYIDKQTEEIIIKIGDKNQNSQAKLGLYWKGIKKDKVGPGNGLAPDKLPDGQFTMKINMGAIQMEHSSPDYSDMQPAWSPVGNKIAFVSNRDGNDEIYVSNIDGTNPVRLTKNPAKDYCPCWSPDGKKIAFTTNRDGIFNEEIYIMDSNGKNQINITLNAGNDSYPAWRPIVKNKTAK